MATQLSRRAFLQNSAALIGVLGLAACAPPSAAPAGGAQPAAEGSAPVPALLRAGSGEEDYFKQVVDLFEAQHPETKINRIFVPGGQEYITKLDLMIAAGDPPAIYAPFSNRGYRYYAARGLSQELDDLVVRDNVDLTDFLPDAMKGCRWQGKLMAMPLDLWPHLVFYNKNLFNEAGVDAPPTDWNDKSWDTTKYLEMAQKLTKRNGDEITQFGTNAYFNYWAAGWIFGGDWWPLTTYETGIIEEFTGDTDEKVAGAVQWAADLMFKEKVAPTPAQSQQLQVGGSTDFFLSNKVAMSIGNIGSLSQYATIDEFEWGVAAAPQPPNGAERHLHVWIDFWSMIKGVKNLEGSWQFLKFMVSAEAQKIYPIAYGPQSSLLSLASTWVEQQKATLKLSDAEFSVMTEAPKHQQIDPENWTVNMSIITTEALQPALDRVWLGEGSAAEIISAAAPDIRKRIDETKTIS